MAGREYNIAFMIAGRLSGEFKKAFDVAGKVIGTCDKQIAAFNKQIGDISKLESHRKKTAEMGRQYLSARQSLNAYEKAVHATGQVVDRNSREYQKLAKAVERTGTSYQAAKAKMLDFAKASNLQGMGAAALKSKQTEILGGIKRRQPIVNFKEGVKERIGELSIAGQAVTSFFSDIIKTGAQFESQMSRVGAVSNASTADLQKLTEQAKKLGAETVWSATEAAQGQEFLAMAGFKTDQIVAAMPGMLSLASAGHIDLASAADIASNVLTGFGMEAEQISRVGDVMAKATSNANYDMLQFGETFKYVAPIAKVAGVSLEQAAAMAGKLGDAGIQGTMAGTTLRGVLGRIATNAAKIQKELGVSVKDSQGNLRNYLDIFDEMAAKINKLGNAEQIEKLKDIFGQNAYTGAAALLDQSQRGTLREFEGTLKNSGGTADLMAKKQNQNVMGNYRAMMSAWESFKITAFEKLAPILTEITENLTSIISSVTDWAKENPTLSSTILTVAGALAGITAIAAPIAIACSVLSVAWAGLGAVFAALTSPIGLVVAAIAGLALAGWVVYNNWETICGFFGQLIDRLIEGFSLITGYIGGVFTNSWEAAWNGVKAIFGGVFNSLIGLAKTPLNYIIDLINKVIGGLNSLGGIEIAGMKVGFNIPQIPKLAQGGIVSQPTLAMIGEGRESEAVLPLSELSRMVNGGGAGVGGSIHVSQTITIEGGSADAYAQVKRGLDEGTRNLKAELERLMADQRRVSYA